MKQKTISKLISSAIAGGMLLTCAAAVSANAAEDKGTAFLYVNDTDGKFKYEGADGNNTIEKAVTADVTKDGSYNVSFDLGSDTIQVSALQLDITGMEHAKDAKVKIDSFKINGEEVKLDSTPSPKVTDSEIEVVIFNTNGDQLFNRETYNQISKVDVAFTVENWYKEEEAAATEATTEAEKKPDADSSANTNQQSANPVPTGDAGVTGIVLVMGTSVLAGTLAFRRKK